MFLWEDALRAYVTCDRPMGTAGSGTPPRAPLCAPRRSPLVWALVAMDERLCASLYACERMVEARGVRSLGRSPLRQCCTLARTFAAGNVESKAFQPKIKTCPKHERSTTFVPWLLIIARIKGS